jgi:hypothetical protein
VADTLAYLQEALGLLPDNTTRLISPDDVRRVHLSLVGDRGGVFADPAQGPWTVPIPAIDTWVDIPIAIGGGPAMVLGESLFWRKDSNGHLFYNYAADWPTVAVPAGYTRQVTLLGVVEFDPNGDTWEFGFTIAGVIQLPTFTIETAGQTDSTSATIISGDPVDVSAAPAVSLSVRNLSSDADLSMTLASFRTQGSVLAVAP